MNDSEHPIEFTASGSEYFRIWIVNLALTIVTIGIYSAWAKVRTQKYFYRSTRVAGSVFDYHGSPLAILKGRLIALVLVAGWYGLGYFSPMVAVAILLAIAGLLPFLIHRSFRFKLYQSSYRGIRFHFNGTLGGSYRVVLGPLAFLMLPVAVGVAFGPDGPGDTPSPSFAILLGMAVLAVAALLPRFHHALKRYQHDHAAFGTTGSAFSAGVGAFYGIYLRAIGLQLLLAIGFVVTLTVGGLAVSALFGEALGTGIVIGIAMATLVFYLSMLLVMAFFNARLQNTVWNGTTIGDLSFRSAVHTVPLARLYLKNALLVLFTLGLYTPFAVVNTMRYRLQSMTLIAPAGLDAFMADARPGEESATGEGAVDLFDIDIAL
jgi:uncharacterized membrane protein YjgN (DUF898 family)